MHTHVHRNGPTPDALPRNFTPIASQGAVMAVDWESRVNFDRLRDYRLRIADVVRDYGMDERGEAPVDSQAANG